MSGPFRNAIQLVYQHDVYVCDYLLYVHNPDHKDMTLGYVLTFPFLHFSFQLSSLRCSNVR